MKKALARLVVPLVVLLAALAAASTQAQDFNVIVSPRSIIVNPEPAFGVEVWVDRDRSGQDTPSYTIGDSIRIGVSVSEDAYVYLFSVRSTGEIQQILPNRQDPASQDNFMRAGETRTFPPDGARYSFTVGGPTGLDRVIAVASQRPLDTSTLADFAAGANFATSDLGQEGFARSLSIIVEPLPQEAWVTDTALFHVVRAGQAAPAALYGTLDIRSEPAGARAFVDGQYVGTTPVRYGAEAGSREVRIEREGYEPFRSSVNLRGGSTQLVEAGLSPIRRTGTVSFSSQPRGAEVLVGGSSLGTTPLGGLTFDEGSYQARFRVSGYEDRVVDFRVQAGTSQTVSTELRALRGTLIVTGNVGGARVYINGSEVGSVPSGTGRLSVPDLPAGSHELVVVAPGYSTVIRDFEISPGRTTEVQARQARR
jgi:hypothetical protein